MRFDHSYDSLGVGWQQSRSLLAIGSGGIFGQGYMQGTQTQSPSPSALPARHTDFIFSVAGEELGQEGEEYADRAAFQEERGLYAVLQRPQALTRDPRGLLTTVTVGSALVCVGLSVLMSLRLSRQMFYPIERLHSAIGEVVHNNLDVYVPPYQDD